MSRDINQLLKLEGRDKKEAEKAISLETSKEFRLAKRKISAAEARTAGALRRS